MGPQRIMGQRRAVQGKNDYPPRRVCIRSPASGVHLVPARVPGAFFCPAPETRGRNADSAMLPGKMRRCRCRCRRCVPAALILGHGESFDVGGHQTVRAFPGSPEGRLRLGQVRGETGLRSQPTPVMTSQRPHHLFPPPHPRPRATPTPTPDDATIHADAKPTMYPHRGSPEAGEPSRRPRRARTDL
jgi:hypothetical protein